MVRAGADVFRVNGAHVSLEDIAPWVARIRRAGERVGVPVGVLVDLPGTKIRVGRFRQGETVELTPGDSVKLFNGRAGGTPNRLPIRQLRHIEAIRPGQPVWLADGQLRLRIKRRIDKELVAVVESGGTLHEGKGVDFPGAHLPTKVPTTRDRRIAEAALEAGADMLALSFVRNVQDVERLKRFLKRSGTPDLPVAVKIEREDAIDALDSILTRADIVLVARGDLGVDVGPERVPSFQRRILQAAARHGRPAIVATEMLETMVTNARPTRAEASDVANAVFERADGVMLSAESAVGHDPALAVRTMNRIVAAAEADPSAPYAGLPGFQPPRSIPGRPDQHVVHAGVRLADVTDASAIVVFTRSGMSAVRVSKERPRAPIYAFATTG